MNSVKEVDQVDHEEPDIIESHTSFRKILKITYPIIVSMFSLNLMVFIDRAFVSKYSLTQFAATMPAGNMATSISSIFLGIIGFASTFIAQYYGAKKLTSCARSLWQSIYLSIAFSFILLALLPITSQIFQVMGHDSELLVYEKKYFYLITISSCFQLLITALSGLYRGSGKTKVIMIIGIVSNVLNILFDWLFIFGKLGFKELGGVTGAGVATILSAFISSCLYIGLLIYSNAKHHEYRLFKNYKFDIGLIKKLLKYGLPAGVQTFVGTAYFSMLLLIIGKSGKFNLACANVAFTIEGISIFPIWGLGTAMSIIVGQERGSGVIKTIPGILKKGILLGIMYNAVIILVYNIFPRVLISTFLDKSDPETYQLIMNNTVILIRLTAVWIIFDTVQIVISNVLRAVGDTFFMMLVFTITPVIFYLIIPYIFIVILEVPLVWIWVELLIYTLIVLTIVSIRFTRGKWKIINMIS